MFFLKIWLAVPLWRRVVNLNLGRQRTWPATRVAGARRTPAPLPPMGTPVAVAHLSFGKFTDHTAVVWVCLSLKILLNATRIGSRRQWNYGRAKIARYWTSCTRHEQKVAIATAIAWFKTPGVKNDRGRPRFCPFVCRGAHPAQQDAAAERPPVPVPIQQVEDAPPEGNS